MEGGRVLVRHLDKVEILRFENVRREMGVGGYRKVESLQERG